MLRTIRVFALTGALALFSREAATQEGDHDFLRLDHVRGMHGGNLVTSVSADPASFSRLFSRGRDNAIIADRLAADLVHINRLTFEVEPSLAKKWTVSRDGRTYTVQLRRGIRFSDGSPFTADDVVFTFHILQDPKAAVPLADQVKLDGAFPTARKLDSHTVAITYPRAAAVGLRTLDSVPMLPRNRLLKPYQEGRLASAWGPSVNPADVVGLGPFRLKEYQRGVKVVLERNPYYWKKDASGRSLPYLDSLTFLVIPDRNTEALRLQAGELDVINSLTAENYATLRRTAPGSGLVLRDLGPDLAMDYLWFNLNPGYGPSGKPYVDAEKQAVFAKHQFRRAVSSAINRDGISKSVMLGLGTPQFGPVSSGNRVWYDPSVPSTPYDPARARALLAEAGLTDSDRDGVVEFGSSRRPLEFALFTSQGSPVREKTSRILQSDLAKVGISLSVHLFPLAEIAARFMNSFEYEAILFGIVSTDIVPDSQPDFWLSSGTFHLWHPRQTRPHTAWESEMDSLTSRLLQSLDPSARLRVFAEMQRLWVREMPAIPTVVPNVLTGWRRHVGNVRPSILMAHILWNAEELTVRQSGE